MKVFLKGSGEILLDQKHFVASGGEGSVYAKGNTAYKIYTDSARMLPLGKITELSSITDPNIIVPQGILLDPKTGTPIGYTMRFVTGTYPLIQTLTPAFRDREGLSHAKMLKLVLKLRGLTETCHKAGVLIVDLNEMNFLIDKGFSEVYGIDTDSYQTKSYPATAIMPSIRDPKVQGHAWTEGSDWFSFACVAYQMFTGIHPFKGKHPSVSGLEARMKAGISVFDSSVTVPKTVYPKDVIPPGYRAWFKAVLQDGLRLPPPVDPGTFVVAAITTRTIMGGNALDIAEVRVFQDALVGALDHDKSVVGITRDGVWEDGRLLFSLSGAKSVGFSSKLSHTIIGWTEKGGIKLYDASVGKTLTFDMAADAFSSYAGRFYFRSGETVYEIILDSIGGTTLPSARAVANVSEYATTLWSGALIQELLGSVFVSVFPRAGMSYQLRIPELDKYTIVDARYDGRVLMVVGAQKGRGVYDRLVFVLSENFDSYVKLPEVRDITPSGLNFVVLDNGTCAHITEAEKLEIWNVSAPAKVRVVEDPVLGGDLNLMKLGGRVGFYRGNKVFSLRLK